MTTKMKVILTALFCCLLGCASGENEARPESVSMVQLIADSERFIGKSVSVYGFLVYDSMLMIYLSKDHAAIYDGTSAFPVGSDHASELRDIGCVNKYVQIEGKLVRMPGGEVAIVGLQKVYAPVERWNCLSKVLD